MSSALDLLASLVLEDGRRWGEAALPWQWDDARAILSGADPRYHFLTRPRGASKTGDLGGIIIAALLEQAPFVSRSYGFAADREQAALLIDAIYGFAARTDGLVGALTVANWRATAHRTQATFEAMASDEASAWGLKPYLAVVDEFAQHKTTPGPRRLWSAVFSAMPKVRDSRLVVMTSAGSPGHPSHGVLKRARKSSRWRVHEVPGPCPWISPEDLEEQRRELPPWEYARLHLNQWTEGDEHLTTAEDLEACVQHSGPLEPVSGIRYCIGIDLGLKRDRTVVTICHGEPRPEAEPGAPALKIVLDRQAVWKGDRRQPVELADVEAYVVEAYKRYNHAPIVCDPWQAAMLMQRLRAHGPYVEEYSFTTQSVGRLAQTLFSLFSDRALALPEDQELLEELSAVRIRETSPGLFRIDHAPDRHDDRAISLALAAQYLLTNQRQVSSFIVTLHQDEVMAGILDPSKTGF